MADELNNSSEIGQMPTRGPQANMVSDRMAAASSILEKELVMLRYAVATGLVVMLATAPVLGQGKGSAPARAVSKAPAPAKPVPKAMKATVKSVSGIVEKFSAAQKNPKWAPVKVGDVLGELTLIRTGLGGTVVLSFLNRSEVTLKSGTHVGISSFRKKGNLVKTDLSLKYGAIDAKVDSTQGGNDFRLVTPTRTLAAAGTSGKAARWGDFSLQFKGTTGAWKSIAPRRVSTVHAGQWVNRTTTPSINLLLAKLDTKLGDPHGGLTRSEMKEVQQNPASVQTSAPKGVATFTGRRRSRRLAIAPIRRVVRRPARRLTDRLPVRVVRPPSLITR